MKLAFGEEREKGEKTRVGYFQGDAGLRKRDAGVCVAGMADAGIANAEITDARIASRD